MFGHEWEPGIATVVARKVHSQNQWEIAYDYIADIQPKSGGPVFRTSFRSPSTAVGYQATDVGGTMPVWCDPGREKAKIDENDPANRYDDRQKQERADFDAVKHGRTPASAVAAVPATAPSSAGSATDEAMGAATAALQAALRTGTAAMTAFLAAKAAGNEAALAGLKAEVASTNALVQTANAEVQRLASLRSGQTTGMYAAPAAAAPPADPLARLESLAALRDRGVLTDEEFAVQKAKILNEN